jgi:predicted ABC-type exoprotein transport system permease subunit
MKFSWNETISWLCILSTTIIICAPFISDYTGIDVWSILYFGIGLVTVAILIIILRFNKKKK